MFGYLALDSIVYFVAYIISFVVFVLFIIICSLVVMKAVAFAGEINEIIVLWFVLDTGEEFSGVEITKQQLEMNIEKM